MNTADDDVAHYLKIFTFLQIDAIEELLAEHNAAPHERAAQRVLAREATRIVHGPDALASAQRLTTALFSGRVAELTEEDLEQLRLDGIDCTEVTDSKEPSQNECRHYARHHAWVGVPRLRRSPKREVHRRRR